MIKKILILLIIISIAFSFQTSASTYQDIVDGMGYKSGAKFHINWEGWHDNELYTTSGKKEYNYAFQVKNGNTDKSVTPLFYSYSDEPTRDNAFAEVNNNQPYKQRFEAMAGHPTKDDLYIAWGCNPVKIDYNGMIVKTTKDDNWLSFEHSDMILPIQPMKLNTEMWVKNNDMSISLHKADDDDDEHAWTVCFVEATGFKGDFIPPVSDKEKVGNVVVPGNGLSSEQWLEWAKLFNYSRCIMPEPLNWTCSDKVHSHPTDEEGNPTCPEEDAREPVTSNIVIQHSHWCKTMDFGDDITEPKFMEDKVKCGLEPTECLSPQHDKAHHDQQLKSCKIYIPSCATTDHKAVALQFNYCSCMAENPDIKIRHFQTGYLKNMDSFGGTIMGATQEYMNTRDNTLKYTCDVVGSGSKAYNEDAPSYSLNDENHSTQYRNLVFSQRKSSWKGNTYAVGENPFGSSDEGKALLGTWQNKGVESFCMNDRDDGDGPSSDVGSTNSKSHLNIINNGGQFKSAVGNNIIDAKYFIEYNHMSYVSIQFPVIQIKAELDPIWYNFMDLGSLKIDILDKVVYDPNSSEIVKINNVIRREKDKTYDLELEGGKLIQNVNIDSEILSLDQASGYQSCFMGTYRGPLTNMLQYYTKLSQNDNGVESWGDTTDHMIYYDGFSLGTVYIGDNSEIPLIPVPEFMEKFGEYSYGDSFEKLPMKLLLDNGNCNNKYVMNGINESDTEFRKCYITKHDDLKYYTPKIDYITFLEEFDSFNKAYLKYISQVIMFFEHKYDTEVLGGDFFDYIGDAEGEDGIVHSASLKSEYNFNRIGDDLSKDYNRYLVNSSNSGVRVKSNGVNIFKEARMQCEQASCTNKSLSMPYYNIQRIMYANLATRDLRSADVSLLTNVQMNMITGCTMINSGPVAVYFSAYIPNSESLEDFVLRSDSGDSIFSPVRKYCNDTVGDKSIDDYNFINGYNTGYGSSKTYVAVQSMYISTTDLMLPENREILDAVDDFISNRTMFYNIDSGVKFSLVNSEINNWDVRDAFRALALNDVNYDDPINIDSNIEIESSLVGYNGLPYVDISSATGEYMAEDRENAIGRLLKYQSPGDNFRVRKLLDGFYPLSVENGYIEMIKDLDDQLPYDKIVYPPSNKFYSTGCAQEIVNNTEHNNAGRNLMYLLLLAYQFQESHYPGFNYGNVIYNFTKDWGKGNLYNYFTLKAKDDNTSNLGHDYYIDDTFKNGKVSIGKVNINYGPINFKYYFMPKQYNNALSRTFAEFTPKGTITLDTNQNRSIQSYIFNTRDGTRTNREDGIQAKYINERLIHSESGERLGWTRAEDSPYYGKVGLNDIVIYNPSTVQKCQILSNPIFMDMRVEDETIFRGGNKLDGEYNVSQQFLQSQSTFYDTITGSESDQRNNRYVGTSYDIEIHDPLSGNKENKSGTTQKRQYWNMKLGAWNTSIQQRRTTVPFINLGREFELVYSDQFYADQDEYGNHIDGIVDDTLIGLDTCSENVLGYGWGISGYNSDGKQYASCFPASEKYDEGHNYVSARFFVAPFDMTVYDKNGQLRTYKRNQIFDIHDLYVWETDNENQKYNDLADIDILNLTGLDGNRALFKFKGNKADTITRRTFNSRQRTMATTISDEETLDNNYYKDKLIYGVCLLSNEEGANVPEQYISICNNNLHNKYASVFNAFDNGNGTFSISGIKQEFIDKYTSVQDRENVGSMKKTYIDIVGAIGNLTLNDVADFRFSSLFKNELAGDSYYVDGVSKRVDPNSFKTVLQLPTNIVDDRNSEDRNPTTDGNHGTNGNVFLRQPHKAYYAPLPIIAKQNTNEILQNDQLKPGYQQFWDVETTGNYDGINRNSDNLTNRLIVKPYYYLYNYDDKSILPLNALYQEEGQYIVANKCHYEPGEDNFGVYIYQDVETNAGRTNMTQDEKDMTNALKNSSAVNTATDYLNTSVQDLCGTTNLLSLEMYNRDYIGSEYLRGLDTVIESSINPEVHKVDGYAESLASTNIGTLNFGVHSQKYYFTQNLPSSVVFIEDGAVIDEEHNIDYWVNKVQSVNGCIIQTMQIQAYGPVWSLEMTSRSSASRDQDSIVTVDKDGHTIDKYELKDKVKGEITAILDNSANSFMDFDVRGQY